MHHWFLGTFGSYSLHAAPAATWSSVWNASPTQQPLHPPAWPWSHTKALGLDKTRNHVCSFESCWDSLKTRLFIKSSICWALTEISMMWKLFIHRCGVQKKGRSQLHISNIYFLISVWMWGGSRPATGSLIYFLPLSPTCYFYDGTCSLCISVSVSLQTVYTDKPSHSQIELVHLQLVNTTRLLSVWPLRFSRRPGSSLQVSPEAPETRMSSEIYIYVYVCIYMTVK